MSCPHCRHENREAARFCEECGHPLESRCGSCGNLNRGGAAFCDRCGARLVAPGENDSESERTRAEPRRRPEVLRSEVPAPAADGVGADAERRQLTVMFCDLVGSTALSRSLDPEELRDVVRSVQKTCGEIADRFGGHIAQYLGDGTLVYFGYPSAYEDDAARAVRAGLQLLAELARQDGTRQRVQMRIGIHTGKVVVGDMGDVRHRERLAMGDAPNLAARLQQHAQPNEMLISDATHRLVEGLFECEHLGSVSLKGLDDVSLYRVTGESTERDRFEVAVRSGLTPLVGREPEMELLGKLWQRARSGAGHVLLLCGEAGIGKSRLIKEFRDQVLSEGARTIEFRGSPYHQNSPLYPQIDFLQRLLGFEADDSPGTRLEKLERALARFRFAQGNAMALIASLLSLPHPPALPPLELSPERQKERILELLISWLLEENEAGPMCCVWEDLHWADPSTLELLERSLDQVPASSILVLLTARPEFGVRWGNRSYVSQITLNRLDRQHMTALIADVAGGRALPPELVDEVVDKTDGVPLFVEELTKMVLESPLVEAAGDHFELSGPLPRLAIPTTLQDSLMARLDRLATVREVAQLAATIGRESSYKLIAAVSSLDDTILQEQLDQLVKAELIYPRGLPPNSTYIFKHALIQEAAYQSLLRSRREQLHEQVARVVEERFPEIVANQPELVAHHYTAAGLSSDAIPHWQRAARRAVRRSANLEAIGHLTSALKLLEEQPASEERHLTELQLRTTLGPALMAARGYASTEVESTYLRARDLCRDLGATSQLFDVIRGLWGFYVVRGDLRTSRELAEQWLDLAAAEELPAHSLWARYALGMTLFHQGEMAAACEHLAAGAELYEPERRRPHRALQDPGVACLSYSATVLFYLGRFREARERGDEAVALARRLSHPFSLAYALALNGSLFYNLRDAQRTDQCSREAIALCTEQSIPYWLAWGEILGGWALVDRENGAAIEQIRRGLEIYARTGAELAKPFLLSVLADAYHRVGEPGPGLSVLAEALDLTGRTGDRHGEAEIYRLRGELTLADGSADARTDPERPSTDVETAERCFLRSIDVAREQGATAMELRATVSLCRLWQRRGRLDEARQRLESLLGAFTEKLESQDVRDAHDLLARVS